MSEAEPVQKAAKRKLTDLMKSSTHAALALASSPASVSSEHEAEASSMGKLLSDDGVLPGDPLYRPLMHLDKQIEKIAAGAEPIAAQIKAMVDGEVARIRKTVVGVEEESVERMTAALEQSAQASFRGWQWRTAALVGIALCVAAGVGGAVGWGLGWRDGSASVTATERGIAEAFRDGGESAELWLKLMKDNDLKRSLALCSGKAVWQANGRKACGVPLWLEEAGAPEQR